MTVLHHPPAKDSENGHTKTNGKSQEHFIERVSSIPIVKDSVSMAHEMANKTLIGRWTLSTFQLATNDHVSNYYRQYLEPHLDHYGGRSLDYVQSKVPVINQPSSEVIEAIRQPVKEKVDTTLETVTYPAHVVAEKVNQRLGIVVDRLEGAADRYLPPSKESVRQASCENQAVRAYNVLLELSRRLTQTLPKTRQEAVDIASSNEYIQSTLSQLQVAQDVLVQSFTMYGQLAQERLPPSVIARVQQTAELIHQYGQQLSTRVHPEWIKQQLSTAVASLQQQLDLIMTELARTDKTVVEKTRLFFKNIQDRLLPLIQSIQSQLLLLLKQSSHAKTE
ncbi:hypothetical protein CU097_006742 [Rhizopus azygosporus]|uniref:Uncharacterized protein n=1 Tax=Rhizopus azygosporus TaxID=86630 RepID=A0A367K1P2_RHIAZ|nr:hypothetical protein CU097_006742 [Rhizopus azygosporus]